MSGQRVGETCVTPLVRKLAAELGVDLQAVTGSGVGGRVTKADVQRAAPAASSARAPHRPVVAAVPAGRSNVVERRSVWDATATVRVDQFARNPHVEDLRQAQPHVHAAALGRGAPPTLFLGGDVPAFLASGQSPQSLLALPWDFRHAAAGADMATFAELVDAAAGTVLESRGSAGALTANDLPFARLLQRCRAHPGNRAYLARVDGWRLPAWEPATASLPTNVQLPSRGNSKPA